MSRLHGILLSVFVLLTAGTPVVLAVIFSEPALLLGLICTLLIWTMVAGVAAFDEGDCFYVFPLTYTLRALNRKNRCRKEAWELSRAATRCLELARSYRERDQIYDAEILEVEAEHKQRKSALKDEDAERIDRDLQDREMLKLTK